MALSDIILRTVTYSPLVTKGSVITWEEEDNNWIVAYEAIEGLLNPDTSTFTAYSAGDEYSSGDYVSYAGNIWRFINAIPATGVTPGSDPLTWEIASMGEFTHQQNHDTYLDLGGANELSAATIKAFINAGVPTISDVAYDATSWNSNLDGATKNALRDKFVSIDAAIAGITTYTLDNGLDEISSGVAGLGGALSQNTTIDLGAFDFSFLNGSDTVMILQDNGRIAFGRSSAITDAYFSIKNDGAFYPVRVTDASDVDLMRLQNNGQVFFGGAIQDGSGNPSFSPAGRQALQASGTVIWDYAAAMFYRNDGSDLFNANLGIFYGSEEQFSIRVDNRKKYNSSSTEVEDWETQTLKNGTWFMATGDLEFQDENKGVILNDRASASKYRLYVSSGVLNIEVV